MISEIIKGFLVLTIIFIPLELIFALREQKILRADWGTDVTYFFLGHFVSKAGIKISLAIALFLIKQFHISWHNSISHQPIWLQFLEAVVIGDLSYYIAHRLLHTVPWLWKFHAVHHSIKQMDWLATVRVHPCDQLLTKIFQFFPLSLLGFNPAMIVSYVIFSAGIAFYIHANISLKMGICKWVIATPEFHHWHHTKNPPIINKNFAVQLPIIDLLFGTLYLPTQKMPEEYGILDPVPTNYLGQIIYPFQIKSDRRNNG